MKQHVSPLVYSWFAQVNAKNNKVVVDLWAFVSFWTLAVDHERSNFYRILHPTETPLVRHS